MTTSEGPASAAPVDPHALVERPSSSRSLARSVPDLLVLVATVAVVWVVTDALALSLWPSMLVSGLVVGGGQLVLALVRSRRARARRDRPRVP